MTNEVILNCSFQDSIYRGEFIALNDAGALRLIYDAFLPELERLKRASSASESETPPIAHGEEGHQRPPSPSRLLFDAEYDEVNRTLTSVLALKWIITDDYDSFTRHQTPLTKLHPESFARLRELFHKNLRGPTDIASLLVAMIISDLGKDPSLAEDVATVTGQSLRGLNHDVVVDEAAKADLLPCIRMLDTSQRTEVMLGLECSSQLNIAQLAQAENVPGCLAVLRIFKRHRHAFALKFMEQLLDVAGAAGHLDAQCAKSMTEPVFQTLMTTHEVLLDVIEEGCSLRAGYDRVLIKRGLMLEEQGFRSLSVHIPSERALLRLLTLGRTADKKQAEWFAEAFESLPESIRASLVDGLSVDGDKDGDAIIPYYMPALISEGLRNTLNSTASARTDALSSLMRFLARVLEGTKPRPGRPGVIIERNLMFARDTIRSEDFKINPSVLDNLLIPTQKD